MMSLPPNLCSVFCFHCSNIFVGQLELNASTLPSPSEARTEAPVTLKKLISVSLNVYLEVHHILCNSHGTFQKSV